MLHHILLTDGCSPRRISRHYVEHYVSEIHRWRRARNTMSRRNRLFPSWPNIQKRTQNTEISLARTKSTRKHRNYMAISGAIYHTSTHDRRRHGTFFFYSFFIVGKSFISWIPFHLRSSPNLDERGLRDSVGLGVAPYCVEAPYRLKTHSPHRGP